MTSSLLASSLSYPSCLSFLPDPPSLDLAGGLLRAWWFEPFLATVCFGIFINWYWYHERLRGLSSNATFSETVSLGWGPLFYSGVAYWIGIYLWKWIVPPAALYIPDGLPYNVGDLVYLTAELSSGIVLYDAIFFVIHWAMHEIPSLRTLHSRHHDIIIINNNNNNNSSKTSTTTAAAPLEARDVLRHGLVDGSLQVLVNILVQRTTPWGAVKTRLARALHNIIVIWMLTESHTASPTPNIWRRWCVGVRQHYWHHAPAAAPRHGGGGGDRATTTTSHRVHEHYHRYQQFFGYLDDLRLALTKWQVRVKTREHSHAKTL